MWFRLMQRLFMKELAKLLEEISLTSNLSLKITSFLIWNCRNGNMRKGRKRLIVFLRKVMNTFSQRVVWLSLTH